MSTQILRPTPPGGNKRDQRWRLQGPWGRKDYAPMSTVDLHNRLYDELVASALLPPDTLRPSNQYHDQVTMLIMNCSWMAERWIRD